MTPDRLIAALRAENEKLQDQLHATRESLGQHLPLPKAWHLSPAQSRMFLLLLAREHPTLEALRSVAQSDWRETPPDHSALAVQICTLRRKLRPHGITIENIWGRGYRLSKDMKELARLRIDAAK